MRLVWTYMILCINFRLLRGYSLTDRYQKLHHLNYILSDTIPQNKQHFLSNPSVGIYLVKNIIFTGFYVVKCEFDESAILHNTRFSTVFCISMKGCRRFIFCLSIDPNTLMNLRKINLPLILNKAVSCLKSCWCVQNLGEPPYRCHLSPKVYLKTFLFCKRK